MTDFDKEEFWKGLGRLYEESVRQSEKLTLVSEKLSELSDVVTDLGHVVNQLASVAQSHERRLDRTEVTVEAILDDLRRHREGRT
jgi:hypothetical protein